MSQPTVAQYLVSRLAQLGANEFFGVAGGLNSNICTAIEASKEARWVGCCNELNAGYAADGYARIKGIGVVVSKFGAGELSVINAVAGAYSEHVPVIHITCSPARPVQTRHAPAYHTLGNGDVDCFESMYTPVTAAQTRLTAENAAAEIERVLGIAMTLKRPVYINLPGDVSIQRISGPVHPFGPLFSDSGIMFEAVQEIAALLGKARRPVIVAGAQVLRQGLATTLQTFIEKSNLPAVTLLTSKGAIDETHGNFAGVYDGRLIDPETSRIVEGADLVVAVGCLLTESNSTLVTHHMDRRNTIDIQVDHVNVKRARFDDISMRDLLVALTDAVEPAQRAVPQVAPTYESVSGDLNENLSADYIYPRLQEFVRSGDIVIVESGTMLAGFVEARLPEGCSYCSQALWNSMGWATAAALGAAMAAPDRRVVLLTGDGAHQSTAQAVGSMLRYGVKPIIVLLNNHGYTTERYLSEAPNDELNDVSDWNFSKLPEAFGGEDALVAQVSTNGEFDTALVEGAKANKLVYIEALADKMDAPATLQATRDYRERCYGESGELSNPASHEVPQFIAACPG